MKIGRVLDIINDLENKKIIRSAFENKTNEFRFLRWGEKIFDLSLLTEKKKRSEQPEEKN